MNDPMGLDMCSCGHSRSVHVGCFTHDDCCDEEGCECRRFELLVPVEVERGDEPVSEQP